MEMYVIWRTCKTKKYKITFFNIKGIKSMASDVINYKYHIKTTLLW